MYKSIRILFIIIIVFVAAFFVFLGVLTAIAYRPPAELPLEALQIGDEESVENSLSVLTWNIGYGGLGAEADFVMDGGTMGRPRTVADVETNLDQVQEIVRNSTADILLLQEVDQIASRSYRINEVEMLRHTRPGDAAWFALNYKVLFVPYPLNSPLGRVKSGLLNLSSLAVKEVTRLQLPGKYPWPFRLFYPTRCAALIRLRGPVPGSDWYLLNVHLSAYDPGGSLRTQQLEYIRDLMTTLYKEGHHVIVGGDWNSLFPGVTIDDFGAFTTSEDDLSWIQRIPSDWTPQGWQWAYDPKNPTCRTLEKPYIRGDNLRVIIDGFLVSPNIEISSVRGIDLDFESSDHNPVLLTVKGRGSF